MKGHSLSVWTFAVVLSIQVSAFAASPKFPIAGKFYLEVDDAVNVFVNGNQIHHGNFGTSETKELTLIPGDRIVVDLWNKKGPFGFKLLFVSTDRKYMINFGTGSFRVLRDPDKHDFTAAEYQAWKDPAHGVNRRTADHLAFKNHAEWVWGEKKLGDTYLASIITKAMFEEMQP